MSFEGESILEIVSLTVSFMFTCCHSKESCVILALDQL